ncbi:hypothetical protein SISNIDRAFT_401863, partial [Sistotremastrum niveocremeum HHB9708]
LSKADVEAIRKDLQDIIKPSWIGSLPKDLGSKRHGKLKSDQWRSIATIFLPITLIRRWSTSKSGADDSQKQDILDNTMDLYMTRYLTNLKNLHPHLKLRPVHHAALHLSEFLKMYGPVHGWWTFPFERLIGTLQKITTNEKLGELEETMLHTFIASSNMRNILTSPRLPPVLQHC